MDWQALGQVIGTKPARQLTNRRRGRQYGRLNQQRGHGGGGWLEWRQENVHLDQSGAAGGHHRHRMEAIDPDQLVPQGDLYHHEQG